MENGQVENHVTETINSTTHLDSNLNSDTKSMESTVEYRLLMVYAQRRRPKKPDTPKEKDSDPAPNPQPPQTPEKTEKEEGKTKKKKTKIWKHFKPILGCVRPQGDEAEPSQTPTDDQNGPNYRSLVPEDKEGLVKDEDKLGKVADRVIGIADEIHFVSELETDTLDDDVEKVIGLLLRDKGDQIDKEFNLAHIAADLFFDYNFFTRLLDRFFVRIGFRSPSPDALGPQAATKTQIAVACEVTSRLASVEALPRSRLIQHGARYLQQYYSSWAQQQGGYEEAFQDEEEVD